MPPAGPTCWILAAAAGAPGLDALPTSRARRVLLTGDGLSWLADPARRAELTAWSDDLALCSRSARDQGWSAETTPPGVRWSSVATWLAELEGGSFGALLP